MSGLIRPAYHCFMTSTHPTKVEAMREALIGCFGSSFSGHLQAISVSSGATQQPVGDEETLQRAIKRIAVLRHQLLVDEHLALDQSCGPSITLLASIEGGLLPPAPDPAHILMQPLASCFAWVRVENLTADRVGQSRSCSFLLPPALASLVFSDGMELDADDDFPLHFKHRNGAVDTLTLGLIDHKAYYRQPAILALIPFLNVQGFFSAPHP